MNPKKQVTRMTVQQLHRTTNANSPPARSTAASFKLREPQLVSGIDEVLRQVTGRKVVTSTEIIDLLLDLRDQLTPAAL